MSSNISFFNDKEVSCPACQKAVKVEVLRQGGGRLDTAFLANDLRRNYSANKKFGQIYPLIYDLYVCEHCWFSALKTDFVAKNAFDFSKINDFSEQRKSQARILVKNQPLDFSQHRNIYTGMASYYLAVHCYNFYRNQKVVEFYKGMLSLRASWCSQDLSRSERDEDYMITALYFRYLAALNYENYVTVSEAKAISADVAFYGPDNDHDFGFHGVVYLSALLGSEFGELIADDESRFTFMNKLLRRLSKIFGVGKKTKSSPSPFLSKVYDLYAHIKDETEKISEDTPFSKSS